MRTVLIKENELRKICVTLLMKWSVPKDDAETIADTIVEANLRGVDTHGVAILPTYLKRLRNGGANPNPNVKIEKEGISFCVFNGDNALGAVVAKKAMEKAIEESRSKGLFASFCRNSNTFGPAFYYSSLAAEKGMVGIAICNAPPSMPPWGGKEPLIGTNPISVAIPVKNDKPIVLDMATSAAAKSKIYLAIEKGEKIPIGWALDKEGKPTDDPKKALDGVLLPMGGHKGYGLALIVDILAGLLSGAGFLDKVLSLHNQIDKPQNVGFLLMCLNPSLILDADKFYSSIEELRRKIKSCQTADGTEFILLPGEKEYMTKEIRLKNGIPIPESIMSQLEELLEENKI
ncbi:Ldh family oxidoreductase [Thermoanaerobacter wiegelii]|uniref:Malate/L-lactate dehydrogenase n=1 Tax=Thermoanaerobacter wiegelii Rt8.B1 TaxID=697303 RepID=G2MRV7_9THEO|nr:Ldh family oxidoreductase [Thermoanaerobacter wiegelii]AEM77703.1 Malate/L-lactate dehydrogenase [Thermoanaerobacter wiegelii Rt8.B1]